jgi:hypothetical protein
MLGSVVHPSRFDAVSVVVVAAAAVLLSACGGSADPQERVTPGVGSSPSPVTIGDPHWPVWDSLREMVQEYDTILVGRAEAPSIAFRPLDSEAIEAGWRNAGPSDYASLYPVEVLQVIASPRARDGSKITVFQRGGSIDGVVYLMEGDPPLQIGSVYLLFLDDLQPPLGLDEYSGPPGARFVINDEGLVVPNGWEGSAGVAAVSAVPTADLEEVWHSEDREAAFDAVARTPISEAVAKIRAARAEAGLPPYPPEPGPTSPATPEPTATETAIPTPSLLPASSPSVTPTPSASP